MKNIFSLICCMILSVYCLPTQADVEYYQFGFTGLTSLTHDHTQTFEQICDVKQTSTVQNIYVMFQTAPRGHCVLSVHVRDSMLHLGRNLLSQETIDLSALPARIDTAILLPLAFDRHLAPDEAVIIKLMQGSPDCAGREISVGIDILTK